MNKTFLVMVQEIRATTRRKMFILFGFVLPILMGIIALILSVVNGNGTAVSQPFTDNDSVTTDEQVMEGYIDEGGLIQMRPPEAPLDWLVEYANVGAAQAALEAKQIGAYTIIPADYVENGEITYVKPEHNPIGDRVNSEAIEWLLSINILGDPDLAASVRNPMKLEVTSLALPGENEVDDSWISELLPNLMAIILYMVIIMTSGLLITAVTDEKKNRVMEVLLSSVSSQQMITGKILALGFLGLLMIALWIAILWAVASFGGQSLSIPEGFRLPTSLIIWACIYAVLGYAIYGAQMAGIGALAPDVKDSRSLTFLVMAPLIAVYMFLIMIITNPDGAIAIFVSLFPLTSPVAMITRMAVTDVPTWQSILAALLQLLAAIFIVRLAARLFHAQSLLSGQPISARRYYSMLIGRN